MRVLPSPSVRRIPRRPSSFRITIPLNSRLLFRRLNGLRKALRSSVIHLRQSGSVIRHNGNVGRPLTTRHSKGIRRRSVRDLPFFIRVAPRIFRPLFQITFSSQVNELASSFMLPMRIRLRIIVFRSVLRIPLARRNSTILQKIAIRGHRARIFTMVRSANRRCHGSKFSRTALLTNSNGRRLFFFFRRASFSLGIGRCYFEGGGGTPVKKSPLS